MTETHAIARYIARYTGFYPSIPLEAYFCDKYSLIYDEIINNVFEWLLATGDSKKL